MTTAPLSLTLAEMQKTPACALREIALTAPCRYYGAACSQMAAAAELYAAHVRPDGTLPELELNQIRNHVERAKTAFQRSQEVEADRVKRTGRDIELRERAAAER